MMRGTASHFLCLMFLLVTLSAQAQLNQTDSQGRKDGPWQKEYSNGNLRYKGQFKLGEPVDTFFYYYPKGELLAKTYHLGNGKSRTWMFHRNGEPRAMGLYLNEKRDSVWTFYNEKGVKVSTESYQEGEKHGAVTTYYPDGKKADIKYFENGLEQGEWKLFYEEDSSLRMHGHFLDGKWHGVFTYYYPDGKPQFKGQYKQSLKTGIWVEYDEKGELLRKRIFKDGIETEVVELQ